MLIFLHYLKIRQISGRASLGDSRVTNQCFVKNEFNEGADLFVINTCSVTENANKECRRIIRKAKKTSPNSFVVVTGCFAQLKPKSILEIEGVDSLGLDRLDRSYIKILAENFRGGPVGIESMAAAVNEERNTIEDVIEPYLIQQGFIMRTSRGRVVTDQAYLHFGLTPPNTTSFT